MDAHSSQPCDDESSLARTDIVTTNPFLNDPTTYSTDSPSNGGHPGRWVEYEGNKKAIVSDFGDDTMQGYERPQNHKRQNREGRSRRLSLNLFKAPFGWHRRRRATCASDLKRMTMIDQDIPTDEEISGNTFKFTNSKEQYPQNIEEQNDADVILKSSRYSVEEYNENEEDHNEEGQNHQLTQQHANQQRESFNPFFSSESASEHPNLEASHYEESTPEYEQHELDKRDFRQSWAAPDTVEIVDTTSTARRRHSVFSDWSIEDCPRLMAFQKKQLEEEEEEERDRQRLEQEDEEWQRFAGSKMSITRSTTDTVLDHQYQDKDIRQHRRHTSAFCRPHNDASPHAPSPPIVDRPRRSSVVVGRNIIRQPQSTPPHSLRTGFRPRNSVTKAEPHSPYHYNDQGVEHDADSEAPHDAFEENRDSYTAASVHPFDRPWRPRSSARRESQSYAQDFMKDGELWVPRPWTTSSSSSSPTASLYRKSFPHEREDQELTAYNSGSEEDSSYDRVSHHSRPESTYHDMKQVQMRPYGQEDDDSENEVLDSEADDVDEYDGGATGQESVYDFGSQSDETTPFQADDHDIRYYYNSMDWQETEEQQDTHPSSTPFNRSRDLLTKRASLAKAKFYKLLKQHPQQVRERDLEDPHLHQDDDHESGHDHDYSQEDYIEVDDPSRSENSVYSVTSSLRARMRLNTKTKTVLRQVKRHISAAARTVVSGATKAANNVLQEASKANNNLTRSNTRKRSEARFVPLATSDGTASDL
ncbi:hypothetical protein BGZ58_006633 [Dissophora ornata]|nr:hypothetical protein BGZ58_006633 [Dissophora ornata]